MIDNYNYNKNIFENRYSDNIPAALSSFPRLQERDKRREVNRYVTCHRGSSFFLGKMTASGVLCCFALLFV